MARWKALAVCLAALIVLLVVDTSLSGGRCGMNREHLAEMALRERRAGRDPSQVLSAAVKGKGADMLNPGATSGKLAIDVGERIKDYLMDGPIGEMINARFAPGAQADTVIEQITNELVPLVVEYASRYGVTSEMVDTYIQGMLKSRATQMVMRLGELFSPHKKG